MTTLSVNTVSEHCQCTLESYRAVGGGQGLGSLPGGLEGGGDTKRAYHW